jgi:hypothetical protein
MPAANEGASSSSGSGGLGALFLHTLESTLSWEHPTPERLKLNACLFFAAFLCSLGVGLSSSLKVRRNTGGVWVSMLMCVTACVGRWGMLVGRRALARMDTLAHCLYIIYII